MDIEQLIKDTFTEHEHVTPDADTVLAATRQRIYRRRPVLSRPLVVAAGVTALTLAAVAAVALIRPTNNPQVGAPIPTVADLSMPYSLDWLPPGEVNYLVRRINIGATTEDPDTPLYGGEYMLTVTADDQTLDIDVQQFRMVSVDGAAFKSGPGTPVTINGQPAVESSRTEDPGGYELYVAHPDGGTMYVHVSGTAPAQQLIDTGRQIAQNIRFPGTTTVTPTFGLRDLPDGVRMCTFGVNGSEPGTSYQLGTCATMPTILVNTAAADDPTGTPGQPVQGHETRHLDENGYHRLWVLDAVGDTPVLVAGWVPLTDLYDIANRLVLPH